jgi:serine/threonine protein kinase/HAMP domain-containing protein
MKLVGRYQIQARIGQGAMANVYRAHDPDINRVLAIKVLKREFCRNEEFAARFLREARAAGALSHPNIVTIYNVGEIQGFPYIAMELLDGVPLDQAAERQGRFPISDVIEIGIQLADALRYAHEQGVVHRDIKPSNIMLGKDGRSVKILDFGIARVEECAQTQAEAVRTQVGQVVGTPRYMSPEQALGRDLDGRSDLFSVGALLYELITGAPAFNGSSAATLALQITQQEPSPINVTPECPRGLRFIIDKLLAKRPERRFANGAALLDALQREKAALIHAQGDGARRHLPLPARMALATTAITAAVLTLGIGFVLDRQYQAMERVAFTSGSSIASFVASNAALSMAENVALPSDQRDWVPTQAFVMSAISDPNVTRMLVVDHEGVIQAASVPELVGGRYLAPRGRRSTTDRPDVSVTAMQGSDGLRSFRFTRPVEYAGQRVGLVDVSIRRSELDAAANLTRAMMIGLGLLTLLLVAGLTAAAAKLVLQPLRRLRGALNDAADGNLDFRISHRRRDEFGDLFEAFNRLAVSMQRRLDAGGAGASGPLNLDATSIVAPANDDPMVDDEQREHQWSR